MANCMRQGKEKGLDLLDLQNFSLQVVELGGKAIWFAWPKRTEPPREPRRPCPFAILQRMDSPCGRTGSRKRGQRDRCSIIQGVCFPGSQISHLLLVGGEALHRDLNVIGLIRDKPEDRERLRVR